MINRTFDDALRDMQLWAAKSQDKFENDLIAAQKLSAHFSGLPLSGLIA